MRLLVYGNFFPYFCAQIKRKCAVYVNSRLENTCNIS